MDTYQAVTLGIIQGLTEFLPVSSSGHLALVQHLFGIKEPQLFFDISLHIGTLSAVFIVFFNDIKSILISIILMVKSFLKFNLEDCKYQMKNNPDIKLTVFIITASIPTAFIGLLIKNYADILFSSINFVGTMLLITGSFLWLTKDIKENKKIKFNEYDLGSTPIKRGWNGSALKNNDDKVNLEYREYVNYNNTTDYKNALLIGIAQGAAVLPGISRSGATITAGLFLGIQKDSAAKLSFLLSIPAVLGAEILSIKDVFEQNILFDTSIIYGTLSAFIVGYTALKILIKIVNRGRLHIFAPYCWVIGVIAIISGVL